MYGVCCKAAEVGWRKEDTVVVRDDDSVAEALQSGGTAERAPSGGSKQRTIEIEYANTRTGESGSARVATNDPDAVTTNTVRHAAWLKRITVQKVRDCTRIAMLSIIVS